MVISIVTQGQTQELEKVVKVKHSIVPVAIGALGIVTNMLKDWLQQLAGMRSLTLICKSTI